MAGDNNMTRSEMRPLPVSQDNSPKSCREMRVSEETDPLDGVQANLPNVDPLFDAEAAAAYLGLTGVVRHPAQAVRAMCRKRQLRSTKVAGKVMVRRSWLEEYISANLRNVREHGRNRPSRWTDRE